MRPLLRVLGLIGLLLWPAVAIGQGFPNRPIHFVVPFPAGGPSDIISRVLTAKMSTILGQPVVVENRAGAGGLTGIAYVARSHPDGYTVAIAPSSGLAMNVTLRDDMPFQPLKDLALLTQIVSVPEILVVNEQVPAKSLAELVALAKSQPGKLTFASTGGGNSVQLAAQLFAEMAHVTLTQVPYKGNAPALTDLVGGHIDLIFNGLTSALPLIKTDKLRALAVTSLKRAGALPDVPTIDESGLKGFEAVAWNGLTAPAATPREVIAKISADVLKVVNSPELKERLKSEGSDPVGDSPAEFAAFLRNEIAKWAKVIKFAKVKPE